MFLKYLLFFTIVLAPLYVVRFYIPLPFFNLPTTFLEMLIFFDTVFFVYYFLQSKFKIRDLRTRLEVPIIFLLVAAVLAVFLSPDLLSGLGVLRAYFIEPVLLFYILSFVLKTTSSRFVFYALFISAFWLCLLGLLQKLTGGFTLDPHEIVQGRISGVYNSANSLALYLGPIAPLVVVFFIQEKKVFKKIFYFVLLIFITLIMVWTKSRGGIIGELVSLVVFIYVLLALRVKVLKKIWFVIPLGMFLMTLLFFYQVYLNYHFLPVNYGQTFESNDTLQIRYFIWVGTINMLKDYPVFGVGLDGFKILYETKYHLPQFKESFQYPHNLLLTVWVELGLLGLLAFLLLFVKVLKLLLKNLTKFRDPILGAGLIASITYSLVHGIVDVPYFKNDLSVEFWVVISLIVTWFKLKENI